jgi:hypothetical protein
MGENMHNGLKLQKKMQLPTFAGQLLHTFIKQLGWHFQVIVPEGSCNSPSYWVNWLEEFVQGSHPFFSSICKKETKI